MQLTTSFAVLAGAFAAGAAAHPSPVAAHAAAHAQFHGARSAPESIAERDVIVEVQEFYIAGKPGAVSTATTTVTTAAPTSSTSVAVAAAAVTTSVSSSASVSVSSSSSSSSVKPTTTSSAVVTSSTATSSTSSTAAASSSSSATKTSSSASSSAPGTALKFCSGSSKLKRATTAQISYTGNTGTSGNWGCNIMEVDCSTTGLYDYTMEVSSNGSSYTCAHWNKIGPNGAIDGFWYSALTFSIDGSANKCFAFEADTQGGMACSSGSSVVKTPYGQFSGTWAEYDYGSLPNDGNSGSDVSVLVSQAYGLPFIGMSIKNPSGTLCSSITSSGTAYQAYTAGMEDLDGVGCTGYFKGKLAVFLGYSG